MKIKLILLCHLFILGFMFAKASPFITKWDLSKPGSGSNQLNFGVGTTGIASYSWETIPAGQSDTGTFSGLNLIIQNLPGNSMIRLKIYPSNFNSFNTSMFPKDTARLFDVEQWGSVNWSTMQEAFTYCANLNITATDLPNLTSVEDMSYMFYGCNSLNGPLNINAWNTSNVKNMSYMFTYTFNFNQAIGSWNTSNVTDMRDLFGAALIFNQPIGSWNTSNVTDMSGMFGYALSFNQPIGSWNTSQVTDMNSMFDSAIVFNQPIGSWNTSQVKDMAGMFSRAYMFNQPIGNWNTGHVTSMYRMFWEDTVFNQPIGNWNTSQVKTMSGMFSSFLIWQSKSSFNQPIGNWDVSNVTDLSDMFYGADSFNQPLDNWNTAKVKNMSIMFTYADNFNQSLGNWSLASIPSQNYFNSFYTVITGSGIDCNNIYNTLNGWNSNPSTPDSLRLGLSGLKFSNNSLPIINQLEQNKGWYVSSGNFINSCWPTNTQSIEIETSIQVHPNPSSTSFIIDLPMKTYDMLELQITDLVGKIIYKRQLQHANQSQVEIDFSRLGVQSGMYMLQVNAPNTRFSPVKLIYRED